MSTPRVIKNYTLTVTGRGTVGLVTNVTLPTLNIVTDDHRAGGMDMPIALDMGMEKMELSFEIAEHNVFVLSQFGLHNQNAVDLIFRAAMQDDLVTVPYTIVAHGMVTSLELGDVSPGEKNKVKVTVALRYLKLSQNNQPVPIMEIDADNMIRKVLGVDQLQAERDAIGLNSVAALNNLAAHINV